MYLLFRLCGLIRTDKVASIRAQFVITDRKSRNSERTKLTYLYIDYFIKSSSRKLTLIKVVKDIRFLMLIIYRTG